jgi:hypothetical protein
VSAKPDGLQTKAPNEKHESTILLEAKMIDPDTYIESRRKAVREYIREYGIRYADIDCAKWTIENIVHGKSISMQKADEAYRILAEMAGEVKPVVGKPIEEWKQDIMREIDKVQEEEALKDRQVAEYMGMNVTNYRLMRKNPLRSRGTQMWSKLKVLKMEDEPEDMYKPKYTSIRQLWRNGS